jgi:hypothetical protein
MAPADHGTIEKRRKRVVGLSLTPRADFHRACGERFKPPALRPVVRTECCSHLLGSWSAAMGGIHTCLGEHREQGEVTEDLPTSLATALAQAQWAWSAEYMRE